MLEWQLFEMMYVLGDLHEVSAGKTGRSAEVACAGPQEVVALVRPGTGSNFPVPVQFVLDLGHRRAAQSHRHVVELGDHFLQREVAEKAGGTLHLFRHGAGLPRPYRVLAHRRHELVYHRELPAQ